MTEESAQKGVGPRRIKITVPVRDETTNAWLDAQDNASASIRHLVREHVKANGIVDPLTQTVEVVRSGRPTNAELERRSKAVREAMAELGADEATIASHLAQTGLAGGLAETDADAEHQDAEPDESAAAAPEPEPEAPAVVPTQPSADPAPAPAPVQAEPQREPVPAQQSTVRRFTATSAEAAPTPAAAAGGDFRDEI